MRLVMVYREKSESRLAVETFLRDFEFQTGHKIETLSPDTRAGVEFTRAYDIVEYPTLLAIGPDGTPAQVWRGDALPTISEVSFYA
jgi:hypothetical protein